MRAAVVPFRSACAQTMSWWYSTQCANNHRFWHINFMCIHHCRTRNTCPKGSKGCFPEAACCAMTASALAFFNDSYCKAIALQSLPCYVYGTQQLHQMPWLHVCHVKFPYRQTQDNKVSQGHQIAHQGDMIGLHLFLVLRFQFNAGNLSAQHTLLMSPYDKQSIKIQYKSLAL